MNDYTYQVEIARFCCLCISTAFVRQNLRALLRMIKFWRPPTSTSISQCNLWNGFFSLLRTLRKRACSQDWGSVHICTCWHFMRRRLQEKSAMAWQCWWFCC